MNPELWRRAEAVFHAALERSPETRTEFLAEACSNDAELRRQVDMLKKRDKIRPITFEDSAFTTQIDPIELESCKLLSYAGLTWQEARPQTISHITQMQIYTCGLNICLKYFFVALMKYSLLGK